MKRKVIGTIVVKYNRNSKKIYSFFTPELSAAIIDDINCEGCEEKQVDDQVQNVLAEFFNKIYELEKRDIIANPIQQEIIKETHYADTGTLKERKIQVYYLED